MHPPTSWSQPAAEAGPSDRRHTGKARKADLALETLRQFRIIFGSVRAQFREIEDTCGVSGSQLWMLHEIRHAAGIGVSDLAGRLSIHQATCSQQVEKLVALGFVIKTRSTEDQRRVGLKVTLSALKLLAGAPGPAEGLLPDALMGLPESSLRALTSYLDQLIAGLHHKDQHAATRPLADL